MSAIANKVTPALKSAANAYLLARAYHETMREKVDEVYREILTEIPVYADQFDHTEQILDVKNLYLCSDDEECKDVYAEGNKRLREMGLKPDDMPDSHCPALVAERDQRDAERAIFEAASVMLELELTGQELNNGLLCMKKGLEKRQEFIDATVGLILSVS